MQYRRLTESDERIEGLQQTARAEIYRCERIFQGGGGGGGGGLTPSKDARPYLTVGLR